MERRLHIILMINSATYWKSLTSSRIVSAKLVAFVHTLNTLLVTTTYTEFKSNRLRKYHTTEMLNPEVQHQIDENAFIRPSNGPM